MTQLKRYNIGTFTNISGQMVVSDPCYKYGTQNTFHCNVVPGEWEIIAILWQNFNNVVATLRVQHRLEWRGIASPIDYEKALSVDSGMLGVYDMEHYWNEWVVPEEFRILHKTKYAQRDAYLQKIGCESKPAWYFYNAEQVITEYANVIPYGCVCRSGLGDGFYDLTVWRKHTALDDISELGPAVGFDIVFLPDEDTSSEKVESQAA